MRMGVLSWDDVDGMHGNEGRPPREATLSTEVGRVQVGVGSGEASGIPPGSPISLCFSSDGRSLCVCVGATVHMCPVDVMMRGIDVAVNEGWTPEDAPHGRDVNMSACCWSSVDEGFATGAADGSVQLWSLCTGDEQAGAMAKAVLFKKWRKVGPRMASPELLPQRTRSDPGRGRTASTGAGAVTAMTSVLGGLCVGYASGMLGLFVNGVLTKSIPPWGMPQAVTDLDTVGGLVIIAGVEGQVHVRDAASSWRVVGMCQRDSGVRMARVNPRGISQTVLLGHEDGTMALCSYKVREMPEKASAPAHKAEGGGCQGLAFLGNGSTVVYVGGRGLRLYSCERSDHLKLIRGLPLSADAVAIAAAKGKATFAVVCAQGILRLYGPPPASLAAAAADANDAAFPSGAIKTQVRGHAQGPVQLASFFRT